jgi:hypothetical protein
MSITFTSHFKVKHRPNNQTSNFTQNEFRVRPSERGNLLDQYSCGKLDDNKSESTSGEGTNNTATLKIYINIYNSKVYTRYLRKGYAEGYDHVVLL